MVTHWCDNMTIILKNPASADIHCGFSLRIKRAGSKTNTLKINITLEKTFNALLKNPLKLYIWPGSIKDIKVSLGKLMWGNCKACHSKFRAPH